MTMTSLVAAQSHIHSGPNLPGQVTIQSTGPYPDENQDLAASQCLDDRTNPEGWPVLLTHSRPILTCKLDYAVIFMTPTDSKQRTYPFSRQVSEEYSMEQRIEMFRKLGVGGRNACKPIVWVESI
jgi:hypothetical protein